MLKGSTGKFVRGAALMVLGAISGACSSQARNVVGGADEEADTDAHGEVADGGAESEDQGVAPDSGAYEGESESESEGEEPAPCSNPTLDTDGDGFTDCEEVCDLQFDFADPSTGNPVNTDGDAIPNACELRGCEGVATEPGDTAGQDTDNDGVCTAGDNSPVYNPGQEDLDLDGVGDVSDNLDGFNPLQTDDDEDGVGAGAPPNGDCDDMDPDVRPGTSDVPCDGADKNCDGAGGLAADGSINGEPGCECVVGEERPTPGTTNTGECEEGLDLCETTGASVSHWVTQEPGTGPVLELFNTQDDDCDGTTDEGLSCGPVGTTRECGTDVGACAKGTQTCLTPGQWSVACAGSTAPAAAELCNGQDMDCDGAQNEGYTYGGAAVGEECEGIGACGEGTVECATTTSARCSTNPGGSEYVAAEELCDEFDNNCNGTVDEIDFASLEGSPSSGRPGEPCTLPGVCGAGTLVCESDLAVKCSSVARRGNLNPATPEPSSFCNGADDDCDGTVDDVLAESCTVADQDGVRTCTNGEMSDCEIN